MPLCRSLDKHRHKTTGAGGTLVLLGVKFLLSVLCKLVTDIWTVVSGLDVLGLVNPCILGTHVVKHYFKAFYSENFLSGCRFSPI